METINISSLKARLSEIIDRVRNGAEFTVYDRKTPVAKLVATKESVGLAISAAAQAPFAPPKSIKISSRRDPVETLLEDRRRRG